MLKYCHLKYIWSSGTFGELTGFGSPEAIRESFLVEGGAPSLPFDPEGADGAGPSTPAVALVFG
jgi:hypothetical protein